MTCQWMAQKALVATLLAAAPAVALAAQPPTVTLVGSVSDSASARPLGGVAILLDGSTFRVTTGSDGSFQLRDLARGPHELLLLKNGYSPRTFDFFLTDLERGVMNVEPLLLSPGQGPTANIAGTVTDSLIEIPIASAEVLVNGDHVAVTDVEGGFWLPSVPLSWGSNLLEFRRLGYEPKQAELWTSTEEGELNMKVELMPVAVRMPEVVVEGERTVYHFGRMGGFIRRSRAGLGHYITRQDIDKSQPLNVTELLRRVPRILLTPTSSGNMVRILRQTSVQGNCAPEIIVDGIRLNVVEGQVMKSKDGEDLYQGREILIDDLVGLDDVDGIEVYTGPSSTPAELSMVGTDCGVILIWTRR